MHRYNFIEELGSGSFGVVYKAVNTQNGEVVAVKKMKRYFQTWDECLALREVASLSKVKKHANVVRLKELIHEKQELYFIFEFCDSNLLKLIATPTEKITEDRIRPIMRDLLAGLSYMHKHGFFHRDVKPENLLLHDGSIKIADFGQARQTRSRPPYTDYVSTRWYRAPELLMRMNNYNSPIDLWAAGCIMAELYLRTPLFPGTSDINQVQLVCQLLGPPSMDSWSAGVKAAHQASFRFPKSSGLILEERIPASPEAMQLLKDLLQWDPNRRPTAAAALNYPFFKKAPSAATTDSKAESKADDGESKRQLTLPEYQIDNSRGRAALDVGGGLSPLADSPTVKRRFTHSGSPNGSGTDLSALLGEVLSSDGLGAGAGGGTRQPARASAAAAPTQYSKGPAAAARGASKTGTLKKDYSFDASAMEDLLNELEEKRGFK